MSRPDPAQTSEPQPPDSASPPELASVWIQQGFQQINNRFDGIDGRLDGIDGRLDGIDGRIDRVDNRIDQLDNRLRRIENTVWVAAGCVIVLTAIVGYVASLARDLLMLSMQ